MKDEIIEIIGEIAPSIDANDPDVNLAEELESMDIIALITEIEDRFGVVISMKDKTEENFRNPDTLAVMVTRLK